MGEFWMSPNNHLRGHRCPGCFGTPKMTTEQFIARAKAVHGDQYDYSKVDYRGLQKKVCLVCPKHGEFWTSPDGHLQGHRCPYCYWRIKLTTSQFIARSKAAHEDRYDYSKVDYQGLNKKVCIICREHGEFWTTPATHLNGHGCPACSGVQRITVPIFIERCTKIHKGKYDSSYANPNVDTSACYVATSVYGSYNCLEVWTLRRFRDNTLDETWYGRVFIKAYYAISPTLVKWFGETQWFKKMWRKPLDRMVSSLQRKGIESTPYQDKY